MKIICIGGRVESFRCATPNPTIGRVQPPPAVHSSRGYCTQLCGGCDLPTKGTTVPFVLRPHSTVHTVNYIRIPWASKISLGFNLLNVISFIYILIQIFLSIYIYIYIYVDMYIYLYVYIHRFVCVNILCNLKVIFIICFTCNDFNIYVYTYKSLYIYKMLYVGIMNLI